ncbi:MAG: TetR/AcrR family transcriptional regulator [Bryobacteraceae bacterium]|nr:TetR/AcrR family transcriptional regulator [Bryobacteraceae bacterium]
MPKSGKVPEPYQKAFADRRRDPDGKREAILRTAVELFHNRGYANTSMNEIAEKLHITKPALYHYFRNKEDILLECYRWGCMLIREFLDEIATQGGTGMEKVESFIRSYIQLISSDFGRAVIRLDDSELSAAGRSEVRSYKREIDRRLRVFVREGIDDGSIAECDPKLTAFAIAGAINWLSMWYRPGGALSPEEIASGFVQTFANGLRKTGVPAAVQVMPAAGRVQRR